MRNITTLLLALLVFAINQIYAQPMNKVVKTDQMIKVAEAQKAAHDYYNALDWYKQNYDETKDKAVQYEIAELQYLLRDYTRAEKTFTRVVNKRYKKGEINPYLPDARYKLARCMKMNGNYVDAITEFQLFLNESDDPAMNKMAQIELDGAQLAREMNDVAGLTVENAGKNLNAKFSEYSPVLVQGDKMYYTAIARDKVLILDGKDEDEENHHAKAFTASRNGDSWAKATVLDQEINRPGWHVGNLTVSPDGNRMYFTRARLEGNILSESKIYYSYLGADGWAPAKIVTGLGEEFINKQPALGELFGKEVLYFVSNRPGGSGGYDIYYATRLTDESFGEPVNLGETINTIGDEETPYYREGALYFSSTGHPGMGGFDVFSATWDGANWSQPANMGKGYNSSVDDLYFSINEDGYQGFLVSNRPGTRSAVGKTCCNDIWTVDIAKIALDLNTLAFSEGKPLNGTKIRLIEMENNRPGETDEKSKEDANQYNFALKEDVAYMVVAIKEGYYPDTLEFNTVGLENSETFERKFNLKPLPPPPPPPVEDEYETYTINEPIRLNNIYYDYNDDKILTDAEDDLRVVLELLNQYPDMIIELSSHTDSRGRTPYNELLSGRRAKSAKVWLLNKGIADERIKAVGYGESQILNHCTNGVKCTDDEHRYNRRTEVKIIAGPTNISIKKTRLKKRN